MLTRRVLAAMIPTMPFVSKHLAKEFMQNDTAESHSYFAQAGAGTLENTNPVKKLMEEHEARRIVLGDKEAISQARSYLFESHRRVDHVDPDIHVHKSWSPMAKITHQRQRMVERDLREFTDPPNRHWAEKLQYAISKLVWG